MSEFKSYKCPACGGDLEEEDVLDTWADDEIYVELCVGICTKCSKEFQWKNNYYHRFEGISEIEEI